MIERGGVFWADLGRPVDSGPAKRRPVVVVQGDSVNRSRIATVVVAVVTSNGDLAALPGNVFLPAVVTGLPKDSVLNVTHLMSLAKERLDGPVGALPLALMREVDAGLRRVLAL